MNYYYDIVLNFLEDNFFFYEWEDTDNIEYIKKIPLFQVRKEVFNDFFSNKVIVEKSFLDSIENKTIKKDGKLLYACLIANKNNVYAYEFNESGEVISRSALVLCDELSILEYLYTIPLKEIDYKIIESININKDIRFSSKIKLFINTEIEKLYNDNNIDKLKFLYLEWFYKKEDNKDIIYKNMKNKLNKEINEEELKIYNLIKLSYNNV